MKNLFILFILDLIFLSSCNTDDRLSGSPVGNQEIETLTGVVSTDVNYALPGQEISFTATLPASFREVYKDSVYVEATTLTRVGSIRKANVVILPNQISATGKILVGGGVGNLFDSDFDLFLSGIKLNNEIAGKHYLLSSNKITITSGSTSIPSDDDRGMTVQFTWKNTSSQNRIQLRTYRDKSVALTFSKTSSSGSAKIKVNNVDYLIPYTTSLSVTAQNFVDLYSATLNTQGITVEVSGESLIFNFPDNNFSSVTITRVAPIVATTLNGTVFKEANYSPLASPVKDFFIYKSQKLNSNGSYASEGTLSAFNPGSYVFCLGATESSQLESNPMPLLQYRCVVKFPDKSVQIFNGTLQNLVPTTRENFIPVFKVVKTGTGDQASYTLTNLN